MCSSDLGSIAKAKELRDAIPGAVILQQFENPSNAKAHEDVYKRQLRDISWNMPEKLCVV